MEELELTPDAKPGDLIFLDGEDFGDRLCLAMRNIDDVLVEILESLGVDPCDDCIMDMVGNLASVAADGLGVVSFDHDPELVVVIQTEMTEHLEILRKP